MMKRYWTWWRKLAALSSFYDFVQRRYTVTTPDGRSLTLWPADRALAVSVSGQSSTVLEWYDDAQGDTAVPVYEYLRLNVRDIDGDGLVDDKPHCLPGEWWPANQFYDIWPWHGASAYVAGVNLAEGRLDEAERYIGLARQAAGPAPPDALEGLMQRC